MNKARPLLLERPGFFSAVRRGGGESRRGAGERAVAGRGRGPPRGGGEGRRGAGERAAARRGRGPPRGGTEGRRGKRGEGRRRAGEMRALYCGARCAARLREACRATQGRTENTEEHTGHPQSAQGIPGRAGTPQSAQGIPDRTEPLQSARGHPRAQGGASKQSVCGRKKARRPPPEGGKRTFFCFAKKILSFLAKTVDKPLGRW